MSQTSEDKRNSTEKPGLRRARPRRCRAGKCRSVRNGGRPCESGSCAAKAGLLQPSTSVLSQLEYLTRKLLDGRRIIQCRPGLCRSLRRRGLCCPPGQCFAKPQFVSLAERLNDYAHVHGYRDKGGANYWQLAASAILGHYHGPDLVHDRVELGEKLSKQQKDSGNELRRRRRRKARQRSAKKDHVQQK